MIKISEKEEAMTIEDFDADSYKDKLSEQGYRDDVLDEMVEKKKAQLQKNEGDSFEYVMNLEKIEVSKDEDLIIAGFASGEALDWDGETINQESLRSAWSDYMKNPVLRYMHGKDARNPDAIGRVIPEYITDNGKTLKTEFIDGRPFIVAKISSAPDVESIRTKISEGVLTGFSVGGRANKVEEFCHKIGKNINRIFVNRLSEVSVVDLPANKETFFEIVKGCVGENCSCDINEIIKSNDSIPIVNDDDEHEKTEKMELEDKTMDNIEMEMPELVDLIKSTVSDMITEQEVTEKSEGYDAAVATAQDLRARIEELEAKVKAQAAALTEQAAMKKAEKVDEDEVPAKKDKKDEDEDEVDKSETRVAELEAEVKALKESPLYKAEQTETVEKSEVAPVSHLMDVIKTSFGGN